MKREYKRCFECGNLKCLSDYKRKTNGYFDLCKQCRAKHSTRQYEGYRQDKVLSWYGEALRKQGVVLISTEWGLITKNVMKFKLCLQEHQVNDPILYRSFGFTVSDQGTATEKEIDFDTDKNKDFKGLQRLDAIRKFRELTGKIINISGDYWTILN